MVHGLTAYPMPHGVSGGATGATEGHVLSPLINQTTCQYCHVTSPGPHPPACDVAIAILVTSLGEVTNKVFCSWYCHTVSAANMVDITVGENRTSHIITTHK